ncbi:MAG: hypothetical protein P8047_16005 [Gammaproteobacteria bacterium]
MRLILFMLIAFLSVPVLAGNIYTYKISNACIVKTSIVPMPDILPPKMQYQINIQLNEREGKRLREFTKKIIGKYMRMTNGFGESLKIPPHEVVSEVGGRFRLSPYKTKALAEMVINVLLKKGGHCGPSS